VDVRALTAATLEHETRALVTRVARVKPFAVQETMVPAAGLASPAQIAIERMLISSRRALLAEAARLVAWLRGPGRAATPAEMQRRFVVLRLRFTDLVSDWDTFGDAITQRSETESGVWLSGLDVAAADALALHARLYEPPPLICYLDRGPGGAIRRARTRLPGGRDNPVALVRIPRERMVGHGIASSLFHECGHQVAALLDLVPSLQTELRTRAGAVGPTAAAWARWVSEIVADLFAISCVGVSSTLGLISVVSLPPRFVFRIDLGDPHPAPWLRVLLSAALGDALHPDPQWRRIAAVWRALYPTDRLPEAQRRTLEAMAAAIPAVVGVLLAHRSPALRGASLGATLRRDALAPARLREQAVRWGRDPGPAFRASPSLALAVIGQARGDGRLSPEAESRMLARLLTHWALRSTLDASAQAATRAAVRPVRTRRAANGAVAAA
jgi:hypothetical protein